MIFLTAAMVATLLQGAAWTWTLYEGDGPVVLANEIPDTPRLQATLECEAGSGVARVAVYGSAMGPGFASVRAGAGSAAAEAEAGRDGQLTVALRTDHPVFSRFIANGALTLAVGAESTVIEVQGPHLAKLRRFAELCGG